MTIELVHTIAEVRERVARARRAGNVIGFVPTMGALHRGHADLIRASAAQTDYTVVSIFVNPLQFGPAEDLDRYPRTLEADTVVAAEAGAHLVFAPAVEEMYPEPQRTFVEVEGLTEGLCGASRPGHFRGVTTVVTKLFNIVQPDVAFFGQKDAQQAAVILRMTKDLAFPVRIVVCPTAREEDGLAISSRNTYLSPEERAAAPVLYRALQAGAAALRAGERDAAAVRRAMEGVVAAEPLARVDYLSVVDGETLREVRYIEDGSLLLAGAVWIGQTRLIDNFLLKVDGDRVELLSAYESE